GLLNTFKDWAISIAKGAGKGVLTTLSCKLDKSC
uniref:Rugosin-A n=1 Tax=Glandirana rugosa TaxID=8410 RepID=RUGA_GLARU|nr:RecName: Full=Rugosin-A [Glandirana rugosa]AAB35178.1 rugosin A=antimicrobial peptide [Rana rugosa, skin, Peptide, 33 aa] [Glandirana rugosa]